MYSVHIVTTNIQKTVNEWITTRLISTPCWYTKRTPHQPPPTMQKGAQKGAHGDGTFFYHFATAVQATGILDSGATGNFLKNGVEIPTEKPSGKTVGIPKGSRERATPQVLLPTTKLNKEARVGGKLSSLRNNLISVPILAANGYTTVF